MNSSEPEPEPEPPSNDQPGGDADLARPDGSGNEGPWSLAAKNSRVQKSWRELCRETPQDAVRCYDWLKAQANKRHPKRCFPLRGKLYNGHWEYEIGGGNRVFYRPDQKSMKAVVWYAGKHPKGSIPAPPKDL